MSRILVTLIGKVADEKYNNYLSANYRFSDNNIRTSRFFSLSLCKEIKPDKLVVLGTTASMWENLLLETELKNQPDLENDLLSLGKDAHNDQVKQGTLNTLAQHLESVLQIDCDLKLIPYGRNQQEQIDTLEILVDSFKEKDTAILDVTNGLRHLPMLVQQSALLLQTLKKVHIENIYYGALDLRKKIDEIEITPVMKLTGLLEIDRWNQALQNYDKNGDYGVFVDLFADAGLNSTAVQALRDAAFYEQTNNAHKARDQLRLFLTCLEQQETNCDEHIKLFLPALKARFAWVYEEELYARQAEVAWLCLENNDLMRAALYGLEAFITRLMQDSNNDSNDHEQRHRIKSQCKQLGYSDHIHKQCYLLNTIRNQLAHNHSSGSEKIVKITTDPMRLKYTLGDIFSDLIPKKSEV